VVAVAVFAPSGVGRSCDPPNSPVAPAPALTAPLENRKSDCDTLTPVVESESKLPEVKGVSETSTLYELLFPTHPLPIGSGDEVKIVGA
jgi:hypothetical protein